MRGGSQSYSDTGGENQHQARDARVAICAGARNAGINAGLSASAKPDPPAFGRAGSQWPATKGQADAHHGY